MISNHRFPETAFNALAEGGASPAVIRELAETQRSKHTMLLHAIAEAASGPSPEATAFRAGYDMLTRIQADDPGVHAWLLGLPHLGGWAYDCLMRLEQGSPADFAYFANVVAGAAVRAGLPFELSVPVRDGCVLLPGLGSLRTASKSSWITLRGDGHRLTAGGQLEVPYRFVVPDDGSARAGGLSGSPPHWHGTPLIRAVADGLAWDVLLGTDDLYLDRYTLRMSADLPADEIDHWRRRVQAAWEILVRHHRTTAEPVAAGVSVIVPLKAQHDTDLVSATTPAAFGAIATSWPPDPVTMAETLVHEFQHVKLGALMDIVPLAEAGGGRIYAPWRQDPRPAGGLLQGAYAHLAIARFWNTQRHVPADPDGILRAEATFARWRSTIGQAARTLLDADCLTPEGKWFVEIMHAQGQPLESEAVPGEAREIAEEVALDHQLTWHMRHMTFEPADVARLATAYGQGEFHPEQMPSLGSIQEDTRKVDSTIRSRLLNMRCLEPARFRELRAGGVTGLSPADVLLVNGESNAAVQAYRDQIADSVEPQPDAWIGLALALHRLPHAPEREIFTAYLALLFDISIILGGRTDPMHLAGWLA